MTEDIQDLEKRVEALDAELRVTLKRLQEILDEMTSHPERFRTFRMELQDLKIRITKAHTEKARLARQLNTRSKTLD